MSNLFVYCVLIDYSCMDTTLDWAGISIFTSLAESSSVGFTAGCVCWWWVGDTCVCLICVWSIRTSSTFVNLSSRCKLLSTYEITSDNVCGVFEVNFFPLLFFFLSFLAKKSSKSAIMFCLTYLHVVQ